LEVLRQLKESPGLKNIPVIMLTAKGGDSDITVGFEMGATDYVVKPFSLGELLARVRKALRQTNDTRTPAPGA
jgi:two-component system phosphate regulon response regulator PhoB